MALPMGSRYEQARDILYRCCDSYTRLPQLIALHSQMESGEWFRLLGEFWSVCDNISIYLVELRLLLPSHGPVVEMMNPQEVTSHQSLPDHVTVFRGCGPNNIQGACWSLDIDIAKRFPSMNRYRQVQPLLVTATVKKDSVLAIKLNRDEAEIIALQIEIQAVDQITL
jgi:hypothetical protein